jgi:hypothetical protein
MTGNDEVARAAMAVTESVKKATDTLGADFLLKFQSEGKLFDAARIVGQVRRREKSKRKFCC